MSKAQLHSVNSSDVNSSGIDIAPPGQGRSPYATGGPGCDRGAGLRRAGR